MSEIEKSQAAGRKRYERPLLQRFPLRPDEAVLGFCKMPSVSGPVGASCSVSICKTRGS